MSLFGNNLKSIITSSSYVPHTLAAELNVNVHTIWKYQNGKQTPTLMDIIELSAVLDCSYNQLFEGYFKEPHANLVQEFLISYGQMEEKSKQIIRSLLPYFFKVKDKGFNERLRALRQSEEITPEYIAQQIKASPSSYRNYESGSQTPHLKKFVSLFDILNTDPDFLLWEFNSKRNDSLESSLSDILPNDLKFIIKAMRQSDS